MDPVPYIDRCFVYMINSHMLPRNIRTCFVTGGTGFIGSHLVDLLIGQGREVRCLVRDPSRLGWLEGKPVIIRHGDLDSSDSLREGISGADAVFHLAGAIAAGSREEYRRVNAEGCRKLGEAALECRTPPRVFTYVSSQAAAGPSQPGEAVDESTPPSPVTDYGRSKLEGERILAGMEGLPLIILRPPAVYGPRDREILIFFRLANAGLFPVVNGKAAISLIHVADLVRGIVMAGEKGRIGGTYFLANDEPIMNADLPALLAAALGRRVRSIRVPGFALKAAAAISEAGGRLAGRVPVFNRDKVKELTAPGWVCSTEAALEDLSFRAEIDLPRGLKETAEWYRKGSWLS